MSLFKILTWPVPFKAYVRRQLIAIDQALNVLANGNPDETLSSRLGRADKNDGGFADKACDILGVIEEKHCEKSIEFTTTGEPDAHHLGRRSASGGTGQKVEQR